MVTERKRVERAVTEEEVYDEYLEQENSLTTPPRCLWGYIHVYVYIYKYIYAYNVGGSILIIIRGGPRCMWNV